MIPCVVLVVSTCPIPISDPIHGLETYAPIKPDKIKLSDVTLTFQNVQRVQGS